eukprot:Awhi_evm2s2566
MATRHVMIAVDNSELCQKTFNFAIHNLAIDKQKDQITICTVITPPSLSFLNKGKNTSESDWAASVNDKLAKATRLTNDFVAQAHLKGFKIVEPYIVSDNEPHKTLVKAAAEIDATMVVIGSRGLGKYESIFLGSVSQYVVNRCHCPVIVVRATPGQDSPQTPRM